MGEISVPSNIHTIRDGRCGLSVLQDMDWGKLTIWRPTGRVPQPSGCAEVRSEKARLLDALIRAETAHVVPSLMPTRRP